MKKLIIPFLILFILISGYILHEPQDKYGMYINMASFTNDTVLFAWNGQEFKAENAELIKIEVEYSGIDASDATFGFGLTDFPDLGTYNNVDTSLFPFTLNYDTDTITIPSIRTRDGVRASKMWSIRDIPSENFVLWLDRGTVSSGYIRVRVKLYKTNKN